MRTRPCFYSPISEEFSIPNKLEKKYTSSMNSNYKILGDLHTHTIASQHAYSTIGELIEQSKKLGMEFIAITDHGPEMLDGAIRHHFYCMPGLPEKVDGIRLYKGAEVNIKSFEGRLDLDNEVLSRLDFVIASYHVEAIDPGTKEENTEGWINVINNKYVDCLGHAGNPVYEFEHEPVVKALKEKGKILEINANSFVVRKGSEKNCADIVKLCKKYEVPVIATSDAHHKWNVCNVQASLDMLEELSFPPELILNTSKEAVEMYIRRRKVEKKP